MREYDFPQGVTPHALEQPKSQECRERSEEIEDLTNDQVSQPDKQQVSVESSNSQSQSSGAAYNLQFFKRDLDQSDDNAVTRREPLKQIITSKRVVNKQL